MTNPNYPKCLHCGQELIPEDCYDMEFDTSYASQSFIGVCPKCNITYQWVEEYDVTYEGFTGLIETGRN